MTPFTALTAIACPLGLANVDTDQLIPARFMARPRSEGYGRFLLHDLRFGTDGRTAGFILDDPRYSGAAILVARRNFGTGSSREAAVYALADYGVRCVIAPSFGDIFAANAVKNGVLPALVEEPAAEHLISWLASASRPELSVDLASQTIRAGARTVAFGVDPVRRMQLLNGWDDLDLTLRHEAAIGAYRAGRRGSVPWVWPDTPRAPGD